jgi:hypothetical protein
MAGAVPHARCRADSRARQARAGDSGRA